MHFLQMSRCNETGCEETSKVAHPNLFPKVLVLGALSILLTSTLRLILLHLLPDTRFQ